jgi:hypothetical protein
VSQADVLGITLALGMTLGAILWEWLRGDLFPRLWNRKFRGPETRSTETNEQRKHGRR